MLSTGGVFSKLFGVYIYTDTHTHTHTQLNLVITTIITATFTLSDTCNHRTKVVIIIRSDTVKVTLGFPG